MSMEEVWEDITLPSLHNPTIIAAAANSAIDGGKNLQDYFLNKDPAHHPYNKRLLISPSPTGGGSGGFLSGGCRTPPPATVLSLKLGHLDQFLESSKSPSSQLQLHSQVVCADKISSSSSCKKRASGNEDGDGDRRHKRLIKNRESADRSRARRQAYTNELEQEIAELKKENAKLRRQLEKVGFSATEAEAEEAAAAAAAAPAQHLNSRKGQSLGRTLTAPF